MILRKSKAILFAALVALAGCASDAPVYNGVFIVTDVASLDKYWVATTDSVRLSVPEEDRKYLSTGGYTAGTFTIDSKGRVTDVVVTESTPPGAFVRSTENQYRKWRYVPGPANPEARPAKVAFTTRFKGRETGEEKQATE